VVNSVSWCDKLASVPSAGFKFNHRYLPIEKVLESWHSILDDNAVDSGPKFQLTRFDDFNFDVNTEAGFKYGADASRVYVAFNHRMKLRNVSGGAPKVEMLSTPQPFTKLLPEVLRRMVGAAMLMPDIRSRQLLRVGTTSMTPVDAIDLPPGISRFIDYMGRPWNGLTGGFTMQLTADVGKHKLWSDRCIHTILRSENEDEVMTLIFDFQRTFVDPRPVTKETLQEACDKVERDSLAYFEELAEGNMFDGAYREIAGAA
jgi:hypothetical protein